MSNEKGEGQIKILHSNLTDQSTEVTEPRTKNILDLNQYSVWK
jgi:hypothetical protein